MDEIDPVDDKYRESSLIVTYKKALLATFLILSTVIFFILFWDSIHIEKQTELAAPPDTNAIFTKLLEIESKLK